MRSGGGKGLRQDISQVPMLMLKDGHWFRDQTRIPSTSSASTSRRPRQSRCRCGSEELNPDDAPTSNKPLDQPARRAGTLESEVFLYTLWRIFGKKWRSLMKKST